MPLDGEFGSRSHLRPTKRAVGALETRPGKNGTVFDERTFINENSADAPSRASAEIRRLHAGRR